MDATAYSPGQAFWLEDCEPLSGGARKDRPVIVVAPVGSLPDLPPGYLLVVAVTGTPGADDKAVYIDIGLPEPCWAVPDWAIALTPDELGKWAGSVSQLKVKEILEKIEDDTFGSPDGEH